MGTNTSPLSLDELDTWVRGYTGYANLFEELVADGDDDAIYQLQVDSMEAFSLDRVTLAKHWDELTPAQQAAVEEADRKMIELDAAIFELAGIRLAAMVHWVRRNLQHQPSAPSAAERAEPACPERSRGISNPARNP